MIIKFILVVIISAFVSAGTSIIWPKITSRARPQVLQNIHDIAVKIPVGRQTEDILGLSATQTPTPINISSAASMITNTVVTTIEKKTTEIVVNQAVSELSKQFQTLPAEQKVQIKKIICQPEP